MPTKRVRLNDDSEASDFVEHVEVVERASSALRASTKRPRLATTPLSPTFASRETSADIDEHALPSTQYQPHESYLEQYQRDRDQASVVPEDVDDAQYEEATQSAALRRRSHLSNAAAENGILESVVVTNFMCHVKLEVKFGPLINFIIGHNGSGKSAVLTAITLCLGGKATSTNRGQNLKAFIRHGSDQATLQVKIKNQGDGAFKHELYGDSIIVERHFSAHGTSGFKLKNKDGRAVSTKRAELDDITDYYALQLDNPVNVLTQDLARQFLANSSAAEKYKFFIKGVQLEQLDNDYCLLGESLDNTERELDRCKEACDFKIEKRNAAQKKFEASRAHETLQEKIESIRRQQVWCQVEYKEGEIHEKEREIEDCQARIERREQEYEQKGQAYEDAAKAHEEAEGRVTRLRDESGPLQQAFESAKSNFDDVHQQIVDLNHQKRSVQGELTSHKARLARAQQSVDDEVRRMQEVGGEREAAKIAEVQDAEAALDRARDSLDQHSRGMNQLLIDERDARAEYDRSEKKRKDKEQEVRMAQARLQEMSSNNGARNPWRAYMPNMQSLVEAVRRETGFRSKPVGPLGSHIRLLRPDWSSVLESYFGNALNGFVVTSKSDQTLLANISRRCRCNVPIFVSSAAPLNNIQEPQGFKTIMSVLEIDNELVRKQIVINQLIDQTILLDSSAEALEIMRGASRFPDRVRGILTKHPTQIGFGTRWVFSASGGQMSSPIKKYPREPRMAMNDRAAIEAQNQTITRLKDDLVEAENLKRERQIQVTDATKAITRHKRDSSELRASEQRADELLADLRTQLEQLRPGEGQLDAFKEQVGEEQQQVEHYQNQMDEVKRSKEEIALSNRENKRVMDEAEAEVRRKASEIETAEGKERKYATGKVNTLRQKNEAEAKVQGAQDAKTTSEGQMVSLREELDDWTAQARQVSNRVPVERNQDFDSLEAKRRQFTEQLKKAQKSAGGSHQELSAAFTAAHRDLMTAQKHFDNTLQIKSALARSLAERHGRWKKFRSAISIRARSSFGSLLSERQYRGRMLIDHATKLLELQVEPDAARALDRNSTGRQTKTLSGGEKSFSTICMLLALWEAMGSPIRCLDEFDVFMDSVNRDISMKMLIDAARGSAGRQFIFITPQAMGKQTEGPDVRIVKLNDPERGQTTLPA